MFGNLVLICFWNEIFNDIFGSILWNFPIFSVLRTENFRSNEQIQSYQQHTVPPSKLPGNSMWHPWIHTISIRLFNFWRIKFTGSSCSPMLSKNNVIGTQQTANETIENIAAKSKWICIKQYPRKRKKKQWKYRRRKIMLRCKVNKRNSKCQTLSIGFFRFHLGFGAQWNIKRNCNFKAFTLNDVLFIAKLFNLIFLFGFFVRFIQTFDTCSEWGQNC